MKRNANFLAAGLTVAVAVATVSGCAGTGTARMSEPARPAVQPKAPASASQTKIEPPILAGKVVETMNAGSYTYISLEKDGRRAWSAVPNTEVTVGEDIILIPGIDMVDFKSTILKRTFDNIHFSAGVQGAAAKAAEKAAAAKAAAPAVQPSAPALAADAKLPPNHPALPKQDAAPATQGAQPVLSGKVVEAMDAGGYTYICLEKDGQKTWAAIPEAEVKVGSDLTIQAGNIMPFFASKSLKRSFENIIFSPGIAK